MEEQRRLLPAARIIADADTLFIAARAGNAIKYT
jgi:hypothetical protein